MMKRGNVTSSQTGRLTRRIAGLEAAVARHAAGTKLLRAQNRELQAEIAKLRRSQDETIRSERLHALGQMASGIVHDFNNSLTPILGASDFLLANPQVLSRQADTIRLLENIKIAAHDAKNMVSRLREFYRPPVSADVKTIDVNAIVEESIMLTRPKWREQAGATNISVRIRKDLCKSCFVRMNDSQLREVLANLIINAVDALDRNGSVTVRTRTRGQYVYIQVRDSGRGMTRVVRKHCFEPFFSTKGVNGTGLGLSVAYGIIRKYNGSIRVAASTPGKGTTIEIKLPAVMEAPANQPAEELSPVVTRPLKILVCEKDPMTRQTIARYLRMDGHQVDLACTGRAALARISKGSFDLVFLDALMPSGNGLAISSIMRKASPACAIVMTGNPDMEGGAQGAQDKAAAVLNKPFTHRDVRKAIVEAVDCMAVNAAE